MVQTLISGNAKYDLSGNTVYCKALKTGFYQGGAASNTATFGSINAGSAVTLSPGLHEGLTVLMNTAAGSTVTLPAATGTGNYYDVLVTTTVTSNNHIFKTNGTDTFCGALDINGTTSASFPLTGTNKTITMNGSTTGGIIGTMFHVQDVATNLWYCNAALVGSGTVTTPIT